MAAVKTTGVVLPPDWLITKKVAIPAENDIIAIFMKQGPGLDVTGYQSIFILYIF